MRTIPAQAVPTDSNFVIRVDDSYIAEWKAFFEQKKNWPIELWEPYMDGLVDAGILFKRANLYEFVLPEYEVYSATSANQFLDLDDTLAVRGTNKYPFLDGEPAQPIYIRAQVWEIPFDTKIVVHNPNQAKHKIERDNPTNAFLKLRYPKKAYADRDKRKDKIKDKDKIKPKKDK